MFRPAKPALAGLLTLSLLAPAALAQTQLPEVVISAGQTPQDADRVGASVTVLHGDKLRADGITNLVDALRFTPGVHVSPSGNSGTLTQVRIRGAEANHLLVMVDGIEVNQLTDSGFDFADFPIDDVDRIEVIRGPQSGIYGANAHAGVISIITRSGRGLQKPQLTARLEGGTLGTGSGSLNLRGQTGPLYASVTFSQLQSSGYNISRFGDERDGNRAHVFTFKGGIDISPDLNVEGVLRYTNRNNGYDPQSFFGPLTGYVADDTANGTYESLIGRIGFTYKSWDGRFIQSGNIKQYNEKTASFESGFQSFGTDGQRTMFDYKATLLGSTNVFGGEQHSLSLLTDYRDEKYQSIFDPAPYYRDRIGVAGEYVLTLPTATTISTALRNDWNSNFPDVVTWRVALSQQFANIGGRLHTAYGKGITDPTFGEVGGTAFNAPNFSLRPEHSTGWDIGWEQRFLGGRIVTDITYFSMTLTDEIVQSGGFGSPYINNPSNAERQGVEVVAKIQWLDWLSTNMSYTYTDATTRFGQQALRRPPHSGSFEAVALFAENKGRFLVGAAYNGKRLDSSFVPAVPSPTQLPGYTLVRAQISYDLTKTATVFLKGENVFDHQYEDIFTYRAPPRTVMGGIRIKLGQE
ncbi:MAG TPA: TonB-dependent receptor [Xanthobacteraceae bacterium]|nr:TonB-dependent receptor [Xanthobacteraceae bacterium]